MVLWARLRRGRDSKGILGPRQIRDLNAFAESLGLKVLWAGGITLAHNVATHDEVDALLVEAEAAGANILKPAQEAEWGGYSGYFADPDGHPWEVAVNPHWTLTADGGVLMPTSA